MIIEISHKNRRQQREDHRQQQQKNNSINNTTRTTTILPQKRSKLPHCWTWCLFQSSRLARPPSL